MPVETACRETACPDPRTRLAREKYFSIRPRPLERWLWSQQIPASAERVFWLHWQEGMQRGDWCSEIPLRRVACECNLDVSTVTRAYQLLTRMGCVRRTDPGRDPANPFQQATAVTEVRLPPELLREIHKHPSRRARVGQQPHNPEAGRALEPFKTTTPTEASTCEAAPATGSLPAATTSPSDPFSHLSGRDRARALTLLTAAMSPAERHAWQEALRMHRPAMAFDSDSNLSSDTKATVLNVLAALAAPALSVATDVTIATVSTRMSGALQHRSLSLFDLARLRRGIQSASSSTAAPELLRQVVWAIEAGALRRFAPLHALNIALKKIREGAWTRPHRMPPNWACNAIESADPANGRPSRLQRSRPVAVHNE